MQTIVVVGTEKGAFILRSDEKRADWSIEGPLFKGWKVTTSARHEDHGWLFGTASVVYGASVQKSADLVEWTQAAQSPTYPGEGHGKLNQIWTIVPGDERCYLGVDDAGLFSSDDGGDTWSLVEGLTGHETRPSWFPGFGGLCCHTILVDPANKDRIWAGISAVGVFRSDDGGVSWTPKNEGVPVIIEDEVHKDIGYCVHKIAADPADANRIWRQDHKGMFRTADGGETWECIENGLPSGFGFPLARDEATGTLFAVPLESDEFRMPPEGHLAVWRSKDEGDSWHEAAAGLPSEPTYAGVLRGCMVTDGLEPGGVYFGTTSGQVWASADLGDSWTRIPTTFPRILDVAAYALED